MDHQRFDELTRALATGTSRRRVLKGIAGGAAAAIFGLGRSSGLRAQDAGEAPGDACTTATTGMSAECSQVGGTTICGDNGFGRDGDLNCCRDQGGSCAVDAGCCGAALCTNGTCGGGPAGGTVPLGAECTAPSQCSQLGGLATCADNGFSRDGALNCCRNLDGACTDPAQCCGIQACNNGVCGGTTLVEPGGACTAASQCNQTGGAVVCADNGYAGDGAFNCCRNAGGACNASGNSADCCGTNKCVGGVCTGGATTGDLALGASCTATTQCSQTGGAAVCADNGITTDGTSNCCRQAAGACTSAAQCCANLTCTNGACVSTTAPGGTVTPGGTCTATSQCSQTGGAVVCADNGISSDGDLNCCRNASGACANGSGCCGSLLCTNGVCGGTTSGGTVTAGGTCTATSQCSQTGGALVCADNGISGDGLLNCCRNQGGACANGSGCCGNLLCTNGVCGGTISGGGTVAPGGACTATSACSQTGGAVVCADNGISSDGDLNCCRNAGGACANGSGCCGSLLCTNGTCGGTTDGNSTVGLGGTCTATSQCTQSGGSTVCADNGLSSDGMLNCCRNAGGACFGGSGCCGALLCTNGVCQ